MVDTIYAEDEIIGTKKAQEIISKFRHAKVTSIKRFGEVFNPCLLYTSDAADDA